MAGANYMGGKRSAARARTRDFAGRLRKRHFGQQRLAAALCNTNEERERPGKMTLESALHEISLAPARRDSRVAGADFSEPVLTRTNMSRNPSSTSTAFKAPLDISIHRKQPSKVLRALDLSDPTSYRDAIDRILSIPLSEMIGLPTQGKLHSAQGYGSEGSDTEHPSINCDAESDVQVKEASNDGRSSANASHFSSLDTDDGQRRLHDHLGEINLNFPSLDSRRGNHGMQWSMEVDDLPHRDFINDSGYAEIHATETGTLCGSILTPEPLLSQRHSSPSSNMLPFSFCSGSQGTEECILDMDTSPPSSPGSFACPLPFDTSPAASLHRDISPDYGPLVHQSEGRSISLLGSPAPINSPELFARDHSTKSLSPESHASVSTSSVQLRHVSLSPHSQTTSCDEPFNGSYSTTRTDHYSPHSVNLSQGFSFSLDSHTQDPGLLLDILNDPDPWKTIGKILNLDTVKEPENDDIHFTRGREGVGYVWSHVDEPVHWQKKSLKINPPPSVEGEGDDEPWVNMNYSLQKNSLVHDDSVRYQLQCVEDSRVEERRPQDDSTDSIFVNNTNPESTEQHRVYMSVVDAQMQTESPCITLLPTYQISPLTTQRRPREDEMCEGPCLFADSGEEDE